MTPGLAERYRLIHAAPTVEDYLELRSWYFHVLDMAVLPEHQRQGLGDAVLTALLQRVRAHAPAGAYVNLLADPPGRRLYTRHGFTDTAPHTIGMAVWLR